MLPLDSTAANLALRQATHGRGLASDPTGLHDLRQAAAQGDTEGLEATARAFEALLIGQMLKQMRSASFGDELFGSSHTDLYRDLYDQEVARLVSEGQGLGIRDMLMQQLSTQANLGAEPPDPTTLHLPERNPWLYRMIMTDDASASEPRVRQRSRVTRPRSNTPPTNLTWPPKNAEEFVQILHPQAEAAGEVLGFDPLVLLAQSALETGWGRHIPRRADGSSSYNLFGIKADRRWTGDAVSVGTLEYRNGVAQRERARFRAYASPEESFLDYVDFLHRNPRYRDALQSRNSREFVRGLQRAGYATDPQYANKILGIYDHINRVVARAPTQETPRVADTQNQG